MGHKLLPALAWLSPLAIVAAVFVPLAGHGFIRDDYAWVLHSRVASVADAMALLHQDNGFYRPVVALSFAVDRWLFGAWPRGYGLTNVALALACAASIVRLARSIGLARAAAWLTAALWLLNVHTFAMSMLWISGRTALLVTLSATLSAAAFVRGRAMASIVWLGVALLSKEEAVALPVVLAAWWIVERRTAGRRVRLVPWIIAAAVVEAAYLALRSTTHALTPFSAPDYYRLTTAVPTLVRNIVEYADRSSSFAAGVTVLAAFVLGWPRGPMSGRARSRLRCALVWIAGGFAITIFLPVRSDLYACLPSVGSALIGAEWIARAWDQSTDRRRAWALAAVPVLLLALIPVYLSRAARWVAPADFAAATLPDLARLASAIPDTATVVIDDDREAPRNLAWAFGEFIEEAYSVTSGRHLAIELRPPVDPADRASVLACASCAVVHFALVDGRLVSAR